MIMPTETNGEMGYPLPEKILVGHNSKMAIGRLVSFGQQ